MAKRQESSSTIITVASPGAPNPKPDRSRRSSERTAKGGSTPGALGGVASTAPVVSGSLRTPAQLAADQDPGARQRVVARTYDRPQGKL